MVSLAVLYHLAFGFLLVVGPAIVGFAAPVALAATIFGAHGLSILPIAPPLLLAIGVVWLVSIVQLTGIRQFLEVSIDRDHPEGGPHRRVSGRRLRNRQAAPVSFAPSLSDLSHVASAPFAISLVFVMACLGWNAATYIIGEIRLPSETCRARCRRGR